MAETYLVTEGEPLQSLGGSPTYNYPQPATIDFKKAILRRETALASGSEFPRYLLAPEIQSLFNYLPNLRQQFLFRTLFNTGARLNEALALKRGDFCLENDIAFVKLRTLKQRSRGPGRPKQHNSGIRTVPLTDKYYVQCAKEFFATFELTRSDDLLWTMKSDNTARNWLNDAVARAKSDSVTFTVAPITPHTFRHSFCMHLLLSGVPIKLVQKYAGHARLESTEVYTQVFLLDAAEYYPVNFSNN